MSQELMRTMVAVLEEAGVAAAVFEHDAAGVRRVAANRVWAALGGESLDAVVTAGGFVEESRLVESRLEHGGRTTPIEVRLMGTRPGGVATTVAVAAGQPPALRRVAHDLSNPLTYLLIHLRRLRETVPRLIGDGDRPKIEQLLAEALEGGERIVSILRDLLAGRSAD